MADTGFKVATATGEDYNQWTNPTNAYASDDTYASESTAGQQQDYYNFTFGIPAGATIDGVEVTLEGYAAGTMIVNGDRAELDVSISVNGGTTYGTLKELSWATETGESILTYGGATSADAYWGVTLTDTALSNANFRVRVEMDRLVGGATSAELDQILVKVYYTTTSGVRMLAMSGVGK